MKKIRSIGFTTVILFSLTGCSFIIFPVVIPLKKSTKSVQKDTNGTKEKRMDRKEKMK